MFPLPLKYSFLLLDEIAVPFHVVHVVLSVEYSTVPFHSFFVAVNVKSLLSPVKTIQSVGGSNAFVTVTPALSSLSLYPSALATIVIVWSPSESAPSLKGQLGLLIYVPYFIISFHCFNVSSKFLYRCSSSTIVNARFILYLIFLALSIDLY